MASNLKRKHIEAHEGRRPPPAPKYGKRPIITMNIYWKNEPKRPLRVLLDSGCSTPVLSSSWATKYNVPSYKRDIPIAIENFAGQIVPEAGRKYTYPLCLQYQEHFTKESFEIAPMDDECEIMLPWWFAEKHIPSNFFSSTDAIVFNSEYCKTNCTELNMQTVPIEYDPSLLLDDKKVQCIGYLKTSKDGKNIIEWSVLANTGTKFCAAKTASDSYSESELKNLVPRQYHKYISVFEAKQADKLPPRRTWDHAIEIEDGKEPPWGPIYALSETELKALKEYLDEMLGSGKIRPSKSPAGAPILFVPKPHGRGLRLCVDYRGLNKITIKNRYPLPLMNELRDRVEGSTIFTKIDLKSGFNLIRIRAGDEWKTAFRTRYGHYEYLVMPFGLANAPASFQNMMNDIFKDLIDRGLVIYMDDLFMYSKTLEEHEKLVLEVLKRLKENGLVAAIDKCLFHQPKAEFLGHIISSKGVEMSDDKIKAIKEWQRPQKLKDVQSFMGFANFYRRFIKDFSKICKPITDTTKNKGKSFQWNDQCELAFNSLKDIFISAPILRHFDPNLPTVVETDASDFAIGAVLSQVFEQRLHPIAFHSRKMDKAEINYEIHDKEMLAIVVAFKEWRRYLEGACHTITVYSDHKNLEFFLTTKVLNRRQARWAQELAGYDFKIVYRPGPKNGKPDALSRRSELRPKRGDEAEEDENQPISYVLKPEHFVKEQVVISSAKLQQIPGVKFDKEFIKKLKESAVHDQAWTAEYQLANSNKPSKDIELIDMALYYRNRLWIPEDDNLKKEIFESEHDSKIAGHMGQDKTLELIKRNFYWPSMNEEICDYVRSCIQCQRNKAPRHGRYGLLHPLELPYAPWQSIAMDFITDLPDSNGYTQIWVIIDRFTKMAHFIPLLDNEKKSEHLAKIFVKNIWKLHGLPTDIVSDRDKRFTSQLWIDMCKILGIKQRMSTAYQPETDGQTERVNPTIEHYLRCFTNYEQNNWDELLPMAEYAYNNSVTSATKLSPFFANYGFNPRTNWPTEESPKNPSSKFYLHWMSSVHDTCRTNLESSREVMGKYYDRTRLEAPKYKEGDLVMLNGKNLRTRRVCRKLDHKLLGPFEVIKVVSPMAVKLRLPSRWRIHDVFHVKLLEPYRISSKRSIPQLDEILEEMDGLVTEEGIIDDIIDSSYNKSQKKILYLVKWEGYPEREHWTEEPYENFLVSEEAVERLREFHKNNPNRPRDRRIVL